MEHRFSFVRNPYVRTSSLGALFQGGVAPEISGISSNLPFMSGKYLAATSCPYVKLKSKNIELTVDIKGHDTPQRNAYDIFEKTTVSLPNTCVEAERNLAS